MTTLTRRHLLASGAAALAAPGLIRSARAQDVQTLRLHQFMAPVATLPTKLFKPWGDELTEASGGKLALEHYDAMALGGKPSDLYDQARDGVVDIIITLTGYTPGRFPRSEAFELPFIMTDTVATGRAYNKLIEDDLGQAEFSETKILAGWVHGPGVIHTANPMTKLEDMAGLQLRGPTRPINDFITEVGATPVGMPLPAIPEALSKGVIGGTVVPWEITPSIKLAELVHNHAEFKSAEALYTATFVMAMNPAAWDGLSDANKEVLAAKSGDYLSKKATEIMVAGDAPGRQKAVDAGNTIVELDQAEVDRWKAKAGPVYERWIAEMSGQGIEAQNLIDTAKATIKSYEAM